MKMRRFWRRKFIYLIFVCNFFICFCYLIGSNITGDQNSNLTEEEIATEVIRKALGPKGSNASHLVLPLETTTVFQPQDPCPGKGRDVYALFVVISSPGNWNARDAIRSNLIAGVNGFNKGRWVGDTRRNNTVLFFSGVSTDANTQRKLEEEAELHGDIVIDSILDSYLNMTLKLLRMFKWTLSNCPEIKFLLKIDDDVHLNLLKLLEYLNQVRTDAPDAGEDLIAGYLYRDKKPVRTVSGPYGKWFCPTEVWAEEMYPDFIGGPSYLLGAGAVRKIYAHSLSTPLIHLEDVFVTGIIGNRALGLTLTGISGIQLSWPIINQYLSSSCTVQETFLIHSISPQTIRCWRYFNAKDFKCSNWPLFISTMLC